MRFFSLISLFVIFTLLTSCGFYLQGKKELAPSLHRIYLQSSDPYGYLVRNLKESLKMSKVQLVSTPGEADTILVISQDSASQELLASNGTLQTRQYSLKVTVVFEVTDPDGRVLIGPQTLSESRPITIQSNQILGSSNEVTLYQQQMRRLLAFAIMNRLASKEITQQLMSHPVKIKSGGV